MKLTVKGESKEIAAPVFAVQERLDEVKENLLETMPVTQDLAEIVYQCDPIIRNSGLKNPATVHVYNDGIYICTRYDGDERGRTDGARNFFIKGSPLYIDSNLFNGTTP